MRVRRLDRALIAVALSLGAAAPSLSASPSEAGGESPSLLPPALCRVIAGMPAPEPVRIPPPPKEELEKLDDDIAYPPGVMPYTRRITIDKSARRLRLLTPHGDVLATFPVCASANRGQKHRKDDSRTPEGTFKIIGVYNSTDWTYKDTGVKAYGPFFIHLYTPPFYGIGIHGTNAPASVPGRSSHGCVRMLNDNVRALRKMINKDTRVTILPDSCPPSSASSICSGSSSSRP